MDLFSDQFQSDLFNVLGETVDIEDEEDRKIRDMPMIDVIRRLPTKHPTQAALQKQSRQESQSHAQTPAPQETDRSTSPEGELVDNTVEEIKTPKEEEEPDTLMEQKDDDSGIKIVNGEIVIDPNAFEENEEMLYQRATRAQRYPRLEDGKHITSASFVQREHTTKWTDAETSRFYDALRLFGTDFLLIQSALPERSLTQIKRKFKHEESKNPTKLHRVLTGLTYSCSFSPSFTYRSCVSSGHSVQSQAIAICSRHCQKGKGSESKGISIS